MRTSGIFIFIFSILSLNLYGQIDTTGSLSDPSDSTFYKVDLGSLSDSQLSNLDPTRKSWIKKNPYKALVVPAGLIGLGAILIKNPVYDRFDFRTDLRSAFPNFRGSTIDDYLIYSPYVLLAGLNLVKINCQNDFINTGLIIIKAEIINVGVMFALKRLTAIQRPNGEPWAWPSGHTSEAFLAATIVNREFRHKTPWIGVAAYGLAGTVGFFRMLNNKHWLSDVVAGAGLGILSANVTYLTHRWRWGRPGTCFIPTMINGSPGVVFSHSF